LIEKSRIAYRIQNLGASALQPLDAASPLADRVYQSILDAICDGGLKPGERLTQEDLAERLKVSRQPVLQALSLLRAQGFVEEAGRRGLRVAPVEAPQVVRLYEVRGALDALAARLAARDGAAEARRSGPRLIEAGRAAIAAGDRARLVAADQDFHRFLYGLSQNPLIGETAGLHWRHIRRAMGAVLDDPREHRPVWDEHALILGAIAEGDEAGAEARAHAHAEAAAERLVRRIEASARAAA
jgi:DNA-binding GntR family transcriptional regulator